MGSPFRLTPGSMPPRLEDSNVASPTQVNHQQMNNNPVGNQLRQFSTQDYPSPPYVQQHPNRLAASQPRYHHEIVHPGFENRHIPSHNVNNQHVYDSQLSGQNSWVSPSRYVNTSPQVQQYNGPHVFDNQLNSQSSWVSPLRQANTSPHVQQYNNQHAYDSQLSGQNSWVSPSRHEDTSPQIQQYNSQPLSSPIRFQYGNARSYRLPSSPNSINTSQSREFSSPGHAASAQAQQANRILDARVSPFLSGRPRPYDRLPSSPNSVNNSEGREFSSPGHAASMQVQQASRISDIRVSPFRSGHGIVSPGLGSSVVHNGQTHNNQDIHNGNLAWNNQTHHNQTYNQHRMFFPPSRSSPSFPRQQTNISRTSGSPPRFGHIDIPFHLSYNASPFANIGNDQQSHPNRSNPHILDSVVVDYTNPTYAQLPLDPFGLVSIIPGVQDRGINDWFNSAPGVGPTQYLGPDIFVNNTASTGGQHLQTSALVDHADDIGFQQHDHDLTASTPDQEPEGDSGSEFPGPNTISPRLIPLSDPDSSGESYLPLSSSVSASASAPDSPPANEIQGIAADFHPIDHGVNEDIFAAVSEPGSPIVPAEEAMGEWRGGGWCGEETPRASEPTDPTEERAVLEFWLREVEERERV